jgi:AcrR family transcriptional regulator
MSDKKDKVLEVATLLFAKNGYENTSIESICNEAKVSKGLVYHHFKSKDYILIEIFTQITDRMIEMNVQTEVSSNPKTRLKQLIETIFFQLEQDKMLFLFNLNIMFQPTTRKILRKQIEERANILFNSVKSIFDQMALEKSSILSYMFIAEIDGIALSYLSIYNDYPIEEIKIELLKKYNNI